MIQVIPFVAACEPDYLALLSRGLTDLSAMRFNSIEILSQVNLDLKFDEWERFSEPRISPFSWEGQELWFIAKLEGAAEIGIQLALFDPQLKKMVYQDTFQVAEDKFLLTWENHLEVLLQLLQPGPEEILANRRMFTKSLPAFLAFREGLEVLAQAKNLRSRDEGLESLLMAVAYDPEFVEAADILMLFLVQSDFGADYEHSVVILERLRQLVNDHPRIPLVLAEVYYQWGNFIKAEELMREVVNVFPNFSEGRIRLALFLQTTERSDEAARVLETILHNDSENVTVLDLLAAIYAANGAGIAAASMWEKALTLDPKRVNILSNLALLAEESDQPEQAEEYFQSALEFNEEWWGTYYNYGSFCRRQERFEEALGWLEKAVNLNPGHYASLQNLALTQIQLERYNEAQESLLQLLQLAPDNDARRQTLQLLSKLDDNYVKVELRLRQLGRIWDAGKTWLVINNLIRLAAKAWRHWYFWYLLSRISARKFKSLAKFFYQVGMRYNPGYPLLKELALSYFKEDKFRNALPILRRAYLLNQSDQETARAYLQSLVRLGEVEELHANIKKISQFMAEDGRRIT